MKRINYTKNGNYRVATFYAENADLDVDLRYEVIQGPDGYSFATVANCGRDRASVWSGPEETTLSSFSDGFGGVGFFALIQRIFNRHGAGICKYRIGVKEFW